MKHIPILVVVWLTMAVFITKLVMAFHLNSFILALIIGLVVGYLFYELIDNMLKTSDKYLK